MTIRSAVFATTVIITVSTFAAYLLYGLLPHMQQQSSYFNLAFIQKVNVFFGVTAELVYQPIFDFSYNFFHKSYPFLIYPLDHRVAGIALFPHEPRIAHGVGFGVPFKVTIHSAVQAA